MPLTIENPYARLSDPPPPEIAAAGLALLHSESDNTATDIALSGNPTKLLVYIVFKIGHEIGISCNYAEKTSSCTYMAVEKHSPESDEIDFAEVHVEHHDDVNTANAIIVGLMNTDNTPGAPDAWRVIYKPALQTISFVQHSSVANTKPVVQKISVFGA